MPRRRTPRVGDRPIRAAIYHRVSSDEQFEGYSLDALDRATRAYCEAHGWTVAWDYRDEGKSARSDDLAKRPDFARMLSDAEAGLFDVVVVHKLDRFARNRRVAFDAFHRLGRNGVGFVSITEGQDFATAQGQLMLTMLVGLAQFYSDNLSGETRKGKAERKAQRLFNGLLPFGIKSNTKRDADGVPVADPHAAPVPDPETYPGLLLAFSLAAEGKSDRDVAEALNAAGNRTTGNRGKNPFTKDSIRRILTNRFYLGELPDGNGGWIAGAHEAVLDEELFMRALDARQANAHPAANVRRAHRRYSLSGLAVCGGCGGPLHFHTAPNGRARGYCYQTRQRSGCGQHAFYLDGIEAQLGAYLATFTLPAETVDAVVRLYNDATVQRDDDERRRREIASRLERIKELYKWGDLTREAYIADRDRLEAELATLNGATDQATVLMKAAGLLRDLATGWAQASEEQKHDLAKLVFRSVEIAEDRVIAVIPQADLAPFFNLAEDNQTGRSDTTDPERQGCVLTSESDGLPSGAKPPIAFVPTSAIWVGRLPDRRRRGPSRRETYLTPRARRLDDEGRQRACLLARQGRTLREIGAELGVSRETVRHVFRDAEAAVA
jgi:DNA invertase Pin-like site-specific DNA recombinase